MSKRTTTLVWYSAIPLWLLISFARKYPEFIEKYYSRLFYPFFFDLHQIFFDLIPFSLGDVLYVVLILCLPKAIFRKIPFWRAKPLNMFLDIGTVAILTVWIFHLSWGFNYHRLPLSEQIKISTKYSKEDLVVQLDKIIQESNQSHIRLVSSDTMAVTYPFSKEQVSEKITLYHPIYHETILHASVVKNRY